LVVFGDAGAGKSVLAIQLLLDLATAEHTIATSGPAARIRVPVRLSLPAFRDISDRSTATNVRGQLDDWIATHLATVYGLVRSVARMLVADGWVLPILDGLDEMDLDQADPRRARAVLAALNMPAGPGRWSVVLTCRTTYYHDLVHATDRGREGVLQDATVVTMQPLHIDQIIAWLTHRFPNRAQRDGIQQRWQPIVLRLRRHPTGRLAKCLSSPLRLYLAVTAYHDPDSRPGELCALDPNDLDKHLFDRLIPAVTTQCPGRGYARYQLADVKRWAAYLGRPSRSHGCPQPIPR
jgi:predicted NACHT family NTPase